MIVLPGDKLDLPGERIGPGLVQRPLNSPRPVVAGELKFSGTMKTDYIEANSKRYTPAVGDFVLGVIENRFPNAYKVLLQEYSKPVRLNADAFEHASKKGRPNLQIGDIVYACVSNADRDVEAEIQCFDKKTGKANGFGELKGGYIAKVSLAFARQLLSAGHPVLEAVGAKYTYECAIGVNGRVWVNAEDAFATLKIAQWIQAADTLPPDRILDLVALETFPVVEETEKTQ